MFSCAKLRNPSVQTRSAKQPTCPLAGYPSGIDSVRVARCVRGWLGLTATLSPSGSRRVRTSGALLRGCDAPSAETREATISSSKSCPDRSADTRLPHRLRDDRGKAATSLGSVENTGPLRRVLYPGSPVTIDQLVVSVRRTHFRVWRDGCYRPRFISSTAIVRQVDRWFGFKPCRSATSFTNAPGRRLSETICAFTSSGQCR